MTLRLDPNHPFVWRTPVSAQFGVDRPLVVLPRVSLADERMLAALRVGVPRGALSVIGEEAGGSEADVRRLLHRLEPVLLDGPPADHEPGGTVALAGAGPTADRVAATLTQCGLRVLPVSPGTAPRRGRRRPDIAVVLAHFVIEPPLHGYWLREDVPHLPVVFGDTQVHLGPMIEPGAGPCLYCLERQRTDADEAWPAMASQLLGGHSRAETPLVSADVAARTARLLVSRLRDGPMAKAQSWHVQVDTGRVTTRLEHPHAACLCTGIERSLAG
jgi:hypothetical protein